MTRRRKRSAIILAAGYSRRMQRFKPLLLLGGQTVLERVVSLHRSIGVTDIRVVTGFRSEAIRSALTSLPVTVVHNPAHDTGMFSSVRAGVNSLPADVPSFFVHPVDIPLVRPQTLAALMDAFDENPSPVVYPVFDDTRGHPPLIHGEMKTAILSHSGSGGLRTLLRGFDSSAREIQVADEGVLLDLDTPDDFQRLSTRLEDSAILNEAECRVLIEKVCMLPETMIDHCRQVARVAEGLARAVNSSGGAIDAPLVRSAARVHDLARLERNHAAAGAGLLDAMGYPAMAAIVAAHMDIDVSADSPLDEAQIVYLADKLVAGNTVVDLLRRFEAKEKQYGRDPKALAKIRQRRRSAFCIQKKIEQISGSPIEIILTEAGIIDGSQPCKTP
ncbi:MAG: NTP transferase domain-containing protein [Deltaproteobacteria bacterium]|nr:NTP transferase domain-containing protein [Deltaproteobacteria bacterium]